MSGVVCMPVTAPDLRLMSTAGRNTWLPIEWVFTGQKEYVTGLATHSLPNDLLVTLVLPGYLGKVTVPLVQPLSLALEKRLFGAMPRCQAPVTAMVGQSSPAAAKRQARQATLGFELAP